MKNYFRACIKRYSLFNGFCFHGCFTCYMDWLLKDLLFHACKICEENSYHSLFSTSFSISASNP